MHFVIVIMAAGLNGKMFTIDQSSFNKNAIVRRRPSRTERFRGEVFETISTRDVKCCSRVCKKPGCAERRADARPQSSFLAKDCFVVENRVIDANYIRPWKSVA